MPSRDFTDVTLVKALIDHHNDCDDPDYNDDHDDCDEDEDEVEDEDVL